MATSAMSIPIPTLNDQPHIHNTLTPITNTIDTKFIPRFETTLFRDAAIASPINGQYCYVESYDELLIYRNGWVSAVPRVVFKPGDTGHTNDTGLSDDPHLQLAVEHNSQYLGEITLIYVGQAGDIKIAMNAPALAKIMCTFFAGLATDAVSVSNYVIIDSIEDFSTNDLNFGCTTLANSIGARLKIWLRTGSTGGTLKLRVAQRVSSGNTTTIQTGSSLELWKVR